MKNDIIRVKDFIDREFQESVAEELILIPDFVPFVIIPNFVNGVNMARKRNDFVRSIAPNSSNNAIIQKYEESRNKRKKLEYLREKKEDYNYLKEVHNYDLKEVLDFIEKCPQFDGILKKDIS